MTSSFKCLIWLCCSRDSLSDSVWEDGISRWKHDASALQTPFSRFGYGFVTFWSEHNASQICRYLSKDVSFVIFCVKDVGRGPIKITGFFSKYSIIIMHSFPHLVCHVLHNEHFSILNSSPPSATYMRQWIGPTLIQIMACQPFGAKSLSKPMLGYCQLFSESFTKMHLKILSAKWQPFCQLRI